MIVVLNGVKDLGCVPGMGVIYKVKVLNGEGSSSRSSRQGRPR